MKTTTEFITSLGSSDLQSFIKVQQAYLDYAFGEDIMDIGMNNSSGYVYIALDNSVTIASCFGRDVQYIYCDFITGEELFFDSYAECASHILS